MLTICTWLWGSKYSVRDVARLERALTRHHGGSFRFLVVTDVPRAIEQEGLIAARIPDEDRHLLGIKGCFARLRMFDPKWQADNKIEERLACVDLDVVVTGPIAPLFTRPDNFVILRGANAANPCPYNGSVFMLRPGYRPDVWSDFSVEAASKVPFYDFPDDQGWLHHKIPNAPGWEVGSRSGVYAFQKPGWPKGSDDLPKDARMVVFPGWRSPEKFLHLGWVKKHWS